MLPLFNVLRSSIKYRGVTKTTAGKWAAWAELHGATTFLGAYAWDIEAASVADLGALWGYITQHDGELASTGIHCWAPACEARCLQPLIPLDAALT